ncbi:unnamed protein product [Lactuca saligna]|uniref:Protein kinase domain-containing protein n=1 Tax=Lactuca saligna TaxID=75948 RepID=A0AA35YQ33_LACSI|nr:unnamed protein product [Lactuca saligna]
MKPKTLSKSTIEATTTKNLYDREFAESLQSEYSNIGVTELIFSNGMRVYYMHTDFLEDQVLFTGYAYRGLSELPESEYFSCSMSSTIAGEIRISSDTFIKKNGLYKKNGLISSHEAIFFIKVGDFGLSKMKHNTLVSGGVRGTLPWMAPELLNGSNNKVSDKVDVVSFGIVFYRNKMQEVFECLEIPNMLKRAQEVEQDSSCFLPDKDIVLVDEAYSNVRVQLDSQPEGAHSGFGLGREFLRHTERCSDLLIKLNLQPDTKGSYVEVLERCVNLFSWDVD